MFGFVRTIGFKLTVWFIGVLALVMFAVSGLFYLELERVQLQAVDASLHQAGLRSVAPLSPILAPGQSESENTQLQQLFLISNTPARLLSLDGLVLQKDPLFPSNLPVTRDVLQSAQAGNARYETLHLASGDYRLYSAPVRVHNTRVAIVQVVNSLSDSMATLAQIRSMLEWLIPITLLLAGIGGSFLASQALAPIAGVRRKVAVIIEKSDLSQRVSEGLPDDEVGRLARTFDQLLERVQNAMQRERQFTSDASHELRTPLTVLKGEISVALGRPRQASEYRDTLSRLETTVDDMSQLVEDLLTLARATANRDSSPRMPIDLAELVRQVCERMLILADVKGVALNTPGDAFVPIVVGDRLRLQRVFTNLIDNALRYTPKGGRVDVTYQQKGSTVLVDVRDTGRGIGAEHLPRLFQRFYRAEGDRARDSGGSGLGLAIAQTIVRSHGGAISVESQPGKGTCFTVSLPLAITGKTAPAPPALSSSPDAVVQHSESSQRIGVCERTFRAMNTDVTIMLLSNAHRATLALDAAEWFFLQTEWRLSRFRDSSELSALNRQRSILASRTLFEVVQLAMRAYKDTLGIFNPLIGRALEAAGYDRSFDEIGTDSRIAGKRPPPTPVPPFNELVQLDPLTRRINLGGDALMDLGGIAKGWAVDRTFHTLSRLGPCFVNAGDDVRAGGSSEPDGDGWQVDLADRLILPSEENQSTTGEHTSTGHAVMLRDMAITTSGVIKRRWMLGDAEQNHLIDPRSGEPTRNGLLFVSVMGSTTVQADIAAKTIFILGEQVGTAWAADRKIPAFLMRRNGEFVANEWFHTL